MLIILCSLSLGGKLPVLVAKALLLTQNKCCLFEKEAIIYVTKVVKFNQLL
jgi:hypothetical protein